MTELTITAPDDLHLHFRDGDFLHETVNATASCFKRAVAMPNLVPPVVNAEQAIAYRERILSACQTNDFDPIMTLYLTDQTSASDIDAAFKQNIIAAKLYPAGATTNSADAVQGVESLYPVFSAMQECGMLLLIHGEVTDHDVDIFDREKQFIDQHLAQIHHDFPELKIVFEHITTADAADFVLSSSDKMAATITPQHLLLNRNDLLVGGIRPHNYCLPVLKRNSHQQRLREVVSSGSSRFFLGTDSAPHLQSQKESACGCAGCYTAPFALALYAQVFDDLGCLDKLEAFASFHGADFYGIERNDGTVTLTKQDWTIPEHIELLDKTRLIPFYAGETLNWQVTN